MKNMHVAPPNTQHSSLKTLYVSSLSLRFAGLPIDGGDGGRGSAVSMPSVRRNDRLQLSFDLWFALLPTTEDSKPCYNGGIIFGAQSVSCTTDWWASNHQQFIHVDTEGSLYATIADKKKIVASHLDSGRWYHLALTFDRGGSLYGTATQRVYLDGKLVDLMQDCSLHNEWFRLTNWQVGTGCISGGSMGQPTDDHCGWFGFNGLLDEFRQWPCVLSDIQVSRLASGLDAAEESDSVQCNWSMKDSSSIELLGPVSVVRTTRPLEGTVLGVRELYHSSIARIPTTMPTHYRELQFVD